MYAMVGGRVEDTVQEAELADQFGVHPELVERGDRIDRQDRLRAKAQQRQRQHEHEVQRQNEQIQAHRDREVVLLRRVMRDVECPHEAAAMPEAMEHVVDEIVDHEQQRPGIPGQPHVHHRDAVQKREHEEEDALDGSRHQQVAERQREVCGGIPDLVGAKVMQPTDRGLDGDQRKEADGNQRLQAHAACPPALLLRLCWAAFKRVTFVTHRKLRRAGRRRSTVPAALTTVRTVANLAGCDGGEEVAVQAAVGGQLGMERGGEVGALLHGYRSSIRQPGQHPYGGARFPAPPGRG